MDLPYWLKRLAGRLFVNAQSIRWATQGPVLRQYWHGQIESTHVCLDVGCGGGAYAIEYFLAHGASAVLVDCNAGLLALARRQVQMARAPGFAAFTLSHAGRLPFADKSFDRIQCIEVIEHLSDPQAALHELRRVARPNALLVVSAPHPPEWFANPAHVVDGYTPDQLSHLLSRSGWIPLRHQFCMLAITRLISALHWLLPAPWPLIPLAAVERWVPARLRRFLLPYDVVMLARRSEKDVLPNLHE